MVFDKNTLSKNDELYIFLELQNGEMIDIRKHKYEAKTLKGDIKIFIFKQRSVVKRMVRGKNIMLLMLLFG